MVNSVAHILETEFGRSLSDTGVHIIDPFVGTGNFIVRLMQDIRGAALAEKYRHELHCNEVMLLPYYIANLNIEQAFFERTGEYLPFEGIVLADTFELLEQQQAELFTRENTERVKKQKAVDMFVVMGNPPYNAQQVNENDNNKNRSYKVMDDRVAETYVKDSKATLRNKLYDPYIKAIRWASDRIKEEGIVAFVTNNSFLDGIAFDGMRKHLADDFDAIYILDLGGNARKGLKVSDANVFGIRVGVSINLFVKKKRKLSEDSQLFYYRTDELWNKKQKFDFLNKRQHIGDIEWQTIQPDKRYTWLTEGLDPEFETFIPMGSKEAKNMKGRDGEAIFSLYSYGVVTSRDNLVYSFDLPLLQERVRTFIEIYNTAADRKRRHTSKDPVENFIDTTDPRIKWSRQVKASLKKFELSTYEDTHFRTALYRPFCQQYLYFDHFWNEERYQQYRIFPTPGTETENRSIQIKVGQEWPMFTLMTNKISDALPQGGSQCFPFYTYDEDGSNRQENITDWALSEFRTHYSDDTITKWDIFHYTYGLLHHPDYREKYQMNLKRDLPHIPFAEDFWGFAKAGAALADLHVNYESAPKYDQLSQRETPGVQVNWNVEKMKFSKDKTQLIYNDFLTLDGIPAVVYDYRLGTRSALEWVVDQYRVKIDRRSGIENNPNRETEPRYIVDLIKRVITVSLKTVEIVENLPEF
jgi:predicted helicase